MLLFYFIGVLAKDALAGFDDIVLGHRAHTNIGDGDAGLLKEGQ